jgi:hypothetical protein
MGLLKVCKIKTGSSWVVIKGRRVKLAGVWTWVYKNIYRCVCLSGEDEAWLGASTGGRPPGEPPVAEYNGYVTSTYASTYNCGTAAYGTPVLVSTQCVASLNPATINQWQPPVGLVSTGTFANAAGTGDFDCVLGDC